MPLFSGEPDSEDEIDSKVRLDAEEEWDRQLDIFVIRILTV